MTAALTPLRPVLHLSGAKLRAALEQAIVACEGAGGVERFVAAIKLRADVFQDRIGDGHKLTLATFDELLPLMPTVRRRFATVLAANGWSAVHRAIVELLHDAHVPGTADARVARFETSLSPSSWGEGARRAGEGQPLEHDPAAAPHPSLRDTFSPRKSGEKERSARCLRDLAAELLHATHPEQYPLMTRWVWDATPNTGVLREVWHDPTSGDDVDRVVIDAPDTHEAFLVLREELSQFLADNGIFRDMLWYVDLLQAQVYAIYINAQGGAYLKGDFQAIGDPLEHTRRILGLDRVGRGSGQRAAGSGEAEQPISAMLNKPG